MAHFNCHFSCNSRRPSPQVGKLKDRNSYTNGCKWVVGPQTNATAGAICPGALDADTAYPEVYHDSYQSLADALATTEFPRIATFEVCSTMYLLFCTRDIVDKAIS
jgi:hypothetical protein